MKLVFFPMRRWGERSVAKVAFSNLGIIMLLELIEIRRADPDVKLNVDALLVS
jgi:hypothetical protein